MESPSFMVDNTLIPQFFKALKPDSSSISPKIKAENAADRHHHTVVIDLNDDDYGDNSAAADGDDDGDCVFVKREINLVPKGNNQKHPIRIEENYGEERKFNKTSKMGKTVTIDIDDSVQYVDDYGDNDVMIIDVKPFSRKRRKPFSFFSSTEIGESSRSKLEEDDEPFSLFSSTEIGEFSRSKLEEDDEPFSFFSSTKIGESSRSKLEEDDEVVVTEIDPVEKMFLCEICADSKPQKEAFRIKGCSHSYCSDCMKTYVASKLQDGVSVINCPVPSCSGVLEPEYCREILPFEVFVRWGNLLCESVILASQKFYCPFKDCSALLLDDGNEKVTSSECPSCFRLFCAQCKVAWHAGIGCAEYQSLNKDEREKEDIMLRKLAKSKNWQRCPKCKYYVEKSEGCLYMKCRCGVAFCYNCGSIHTDHRQHYCKNCRR